MVELQPAESTVTPQPGDLIRLGQGAPQDFRGSPAVVTQIAKAHCTVAVLDPSQRRAVGECWPNHRDCVPVSSMGRLGTRVVIDGFQKGRGKSLNGSVGTIVAHRKEGHPCFVRKAATGDEKVASPVLVCCVELDVPGHAKDKQVLVEPLFLARLPVASEVAAALAAAVSFGSVDGEERLPAPCGLSSPPPSLPLSLPQPLPAPGPSSRAAGTKAKIPPVRPLSKQFTQADCGEPTLGTRWPRSATERRGSGSGSEEDPRGEQAARRSVCEQQQPRTPSSDKPADRCEEGSRQKKKMPARPFADVFSWPWSTSSASKGGEAFRKQPPGEKPVSWRELLCSSGGFEGESDVDSDGSEPLPALHCANCCAASRKQKKVRQFHDAPVASCTFFESHTRSYTDCSTAYSPSSSFSPRSRLAPFSPRVEYWDGPVEDEFQDALGDAAGDPFEMEKEARSES